MKRGFWLLICFLLMCAYASPILGRTESAVAQSKVLRIANLGEYMAGDEGKDIPALLEVFEEEFDVSVEYSRFDTNERIYNDLKLNKQGDSYGYDLVCVSDYMIQKMIREGMLEKIENPGVNIPNYMQNVSPYIQEVFEKAGISEYAVGYMWGTMGYVYNADYVAHSDALSWMALWNIDYKGKGTLKDSIRDTYFLGLAYVHRNELNRLAGKYESETACIEALREVYSAGSSELEDAEEDYREFLNYYAGELSRLLNDTSAETVAKVEAALKSVSRNIFGYEVDTGKDDMTTGKVYLNLAWSGDAVYIIEEGGEQFYYAVPREGSNIWFDGWIMPKGANKELAYKFMEFISRPDIVKENMEEIGYTSVIAGDEIKEWMMEKYELESSPVEGLLRADLTYFFKGTGSDEKVYLYYPEEMEGRALTTQYPDLEIINRCTIMLDFEDEALARVSDMWVRLRANVLPPWVIILVVAAAAVAIAALAIILIRRKGGGPRAKKGWTAVKTEAK
ncbi:MAG: extracellular solute-binding protein [Clostridiales bacterium]|nr:extracellular solute-binding protein [Clostridiales bacterium]